MTTTADPSPKPTFLIGDRVRATKPSWGDDHVPVGAVGTIAAPAPLLAVTFDHDLHADGTGTWAMFVSQIEPLGKTPDESARLRATDGAAMLTLLALRGHRVTGATP